MSDLEQKLRRKELKKLIIKRTDDNDKKYELLQKILDKPCNQDTKANITKALKKFDSDIYNPQAAVNKDTLCIEIDSLINKNIPSLKEEKMYTSGYVNDSCEKVSACKEANLKKKQEKLDKIYKVVKKAVKEKEARRSKKKERKSNEADSSKESDLDEIDKIEQELKALAERKRQLKAQKVREEQEARDLEDQVEQARLEKEARRSAKKAQKAREETEEREREEQEERERMEKEARRSAKKAKKAREEQEAREVEEKEERERMEKEARRSSKKAQNSREEKEEKEELERVENEARRNDINERNELEAKEESERIKREEQEKRERIKVLKQIQYDRTCGDVSIILRKENLMNEKNRFLNKNLSKPDIKALRNKYDILNNITLKELEECLLKKYDNGSIQEGVEEELQEELQQVQEELKEEKEEIEEDIIKRMEQQDAMQHKVPERLLKVKEINASPVLTNLKSSDSEMFKYGKGDTDTRDLMIKCLSL